MKIKLILCDFDGTITKDDVLDRICALNGKEKESREINALFQAGKKNGVEALKERFALLEGLSVEEIRRSVLSETILTEGAEDLFAYANENGIETLVLSGNAQFVLEYFEKKLGFSAFSGSVLPVVDDRIKRVRERFFEDKATVAEAYIRTRGFKKEEIVAVGDSIADEEIFALSGMSFLINKKGEVQADREISRLDELVPFLNGRLDE